MSDTDDLYFTFELTNEDNINAEFELTDSPQVDAIFEINAAGTTWGSIDGDITNQTDLIAALDLKANVSDVNTEFGNVYTTIENNYTTLDNKIDTVQSDLSGDISALSGTVEGYNTALNNRIDATNTTVSNNFLTLNGKINTNTNNIASLSDTVSDNYTTLDGKITTINNTLSGYGNIVTHNVAEFATAAQGLLADTALQPNDNISELNNNVGYITGISSADVTNALGYTPYNATNPNGYISGINSTDVVTALGYTPYDSANPDGYITSASLPTVNNNTITIQKNSTDVGSFTLNQSSNDTINISVPTDTNDLTNGAGFITSASLPTLEDLTTDAQLAAINSGATTTNIGQIATNATDIGNEVTNRQNADNALQSQIDAIVSSSDVFDIVGTYAELQAYDISTVPVNDIIKVLVDSTHSGAATYYRCVENNNVKSWSYIGSEGAYYTKGEADSKFVEQTITINGQPLSSNVTLTASDVNALPSSTTIGAGVLTVQKNGITIDTFGANDTSNTTINISVPTDTSDLTNNAGFITGIDSTDVVTALGYTPYDSSNPNGYTSNVGTVTSVNNVSPVSGNVTLSIPTATSDLTNDSGFITSADLTNYVTTNSDQNITGVKTFVGDKRVKFKQSASNNKLGFTLYDNNNNEKGYLEFNPSNTIDDAPLMTLGNYATSAGNVTQVGFRRYSSVSGANGAYNLLTPLISDAKTPFNLTTTYTNFYLPLGFTDGTNTVKTAKSGLVDLSTILPAEVTETTVSNWGFTKNIGTVTSVNNTSPDSNGNVTISIPSISNLVEKTGDTMTGDLTMSTASTKYYLSNQFVGSVFSILNSQYAHFGVMAQGNFNLALGGASLKFFCTTNDAEYDLLDSAGLIPDARISSNIARTSDIPSISNLADKDLSNLSATGEAKFQAPLISGTNIKTINTESLLGSTNISLANDTLSNVTTSQTSVIDGQWVIVGQAISTANTVGSYTLDISSLLPADNYKYEIILACRMFGSGDTFYQSVYTTEFPSSYVASTSSVSANLVVIPVGTNRIINYAITSNGNTSPNGASLQLCAYRRIGTNS